MNNLEIKKKYMSKKDWHRIKGMEYIYHDIEGFIPNLMESNRKGVASLIEFKDITKDLKVNYFDKDTVLLSEGYYWFQLAFEKENFWITAILNQDLKLIQIYIDISKENIIRSKGESFFYDLFVDIVVMREDFLVLDEEELKEAKSKGLVSLEEYDLAIEVKNRITSFLTDKENIKKLEEYLYKEINKIK